ncbi:MAG: hypothetical protein EPN45_10025 [Rhizobiaceae bacterium]|nr:MAG: hypothetical protein EPN45_10025 [Rhizobiaceae bacterium]
MAKREEFTIDEIMQDSMIRLLMKADRVDPIAFEAKLRAIAGTETGEEADGDEGVDRELVKACASRGNPCRFAPPGMLRP